MKKVLLGLGIIAAILVAMFFVFRKYTKSFSPEELVVYDDGNIKLEVSYNRPWKKDRVIFGGLVPYGKVWRTGANEASTFSSNKEISIKGKTLKPGKYSLWTIPEADYWTIIFNTQTGQWGINAKGEANRVAERDALQVIVPAVFQEKVFEQFTISFEPHDDEIEMVLMWDQTVVVVPISR
ncbi:MAG TPA: DUF2911 domain-containing protein [Cyclobacteriaceae bacterium]|nr:DUF2911 domain-containing protein [Cyclobacteriaceae bacterium]